MEHILKDPFTRPISFYTSAKGDFVLDARNHENKKKIVDKRPRN